MAETAERHMIAWADEEKDALWRLVGLDRGPFDSMVKRIAIATERTPESVLAAYNRYVEHLAEQIASVPTHYLVRVVIDRMAVDEPQF